ncbi:MAG: hypothetical protein ACOX2H_06030 [Saccharofermentanales bacterium]|nr:hypothetical protein [Bacillota bacterium]
MNNQTLFISVLNRGKAEQVLSEMRIFGLTGGVVLLGEGTVSNRFLEILGLEETQKDIVILPIEEKYENAVHEMMLENFNIDRKRSGIAFSIPMSRFGRVSNLAADQRFDPACFDHQCVFVVVEEGQGKEVMQKVRQIGETGGTILHGRGAGVPADTYFPLNIEPQKDIVMLLVTNDAVKPIKQCLMQEMGFGLPGKGIVFSLPVSRITGGYQA